MRTASCQRKSLGQPQTAGRRIGLFIRSTNYVHGLQPPQVGRIGQLVAETYTFRPLSLAQPRIFHEIISRRFSSFEAALCLDEVFVAYQGRRHIRLPDIAVASAKATGPRPSGDLASQGSDLCEDPERQARIGRTPAPRMSRGYQALLQFAARHRRMLHPLRKTRNPDHDRFERGRRG